MADTYIDQYETLAYGRFAIDAINERVIGLHKPYDAALRDALKDLSAATDAMSDVLHRTGTLAIATYKSAAGAHDPIAAARDVLTRAVRYVESRKGGDKLAAQMLEGDPLSTATRRRPAKLLGTLARARSVIEAHHKELPEHANWSKELAAAHADLKALDSRVRDGRQQRREMSPEVAAARERWLRAYGTAKLLVEALLRKLDKLAMLPEIFDDLAEVHRATNVHDDQPTQAAPATPANPG